MGVISGRTNGAPMKAMSNGVSLSLPKHWTQGSLANVAIPEKTESAVTVTGMSVSYENGDLQDSIPSLSPG